MQTRQQSRGKYVFGEKYEKALEQRIRWLYVSKTDFHLLISRLSRYLYCICLLTTTKNPNENKLVWAINHLLMNPGRSSASKEIFVCVEIVPATNI